MLQDRWPSWPERVALRGFTYEFTEDGEQIDVGRRLEWLGSDVDGFSPLPYETLASTLRRQGDDGASRTVALVKQRRKRRRRTPHARLPGLLLDILVGYGYRIWYAAGWFVAAWIGATAALYVARPVPLPLAQGQPARPLLLALDLLLPVVDLGQEKNWMVIAPLGWLPAGLAVAGWVLTTAILGGLARLLTRPT